MGVEIVQHHPNILNISEMVIDQVLHTRCKIDLAALGSDLDGTPTGQRLAPQKDIGVASPLVFIVFTLSAGWLPWQRLNDIAPDAHQNTPPAG